MVRTLFIGLDGADPELVDKWDLPHIKGISEDNDGFEIKTHGNSGPSWASVMTGLSPREHGVPTLKPGQTIDSWGGIPLWEKIDGYCGVANVPLTYPPDKNINGWMISGMMTPKRAIYTYPPELYRDLDKQGYKIDIWVKSHKNHPHGHYGTVPFEFTEEYREELIAEGREVLKQRGESFKWLLEEYTPVDMAFLCFTTLDRIQHLAFDNQELIEEFYMLADEQIGKVLSCIDDDVEVFLTSDHGFRLIDVPTSHLSGDHRVEGYGITNTGQKFRNLEHVHKLVVESANRTDVDSRLRDLGYID